MKLALLGLKLVGQRLGAALSSQATTIDVTITNATDGIYFTPLIIATHTPDTYLFRAGEPAPADVEAMEKSGLTHSALHYFHRFLNPGAKIAIKRVW